MYPSHILKGHDRDAAMKNGYSWSGGPWIATWAKGDNVTLTPNRRYWGSQAHLDKVVFKFESDTAAEFQAFRSNQVQAIYPQPQIDVVNAIKAGYRERERADERAHGVRRGVVDQQRAPAVHRRGGAAGVRVRRSIASRS